jgi:NitT/TauT family transport system substrate-binding protein
MFTKRLPMKPLISLAVACMPLLLSPMAQAETVVIGTANTATDVGFYLADARGYFREAGIEPKIVPFNSAAQMVAPLGTGQLDAGGGTVAAGLYNGVARGINLRIVADKGSIANGYEYSTLVIRKSLADEGKYKSLADLKGLKLAAAAQGAGSESSLNEALKKGGLRFSDISVVHMGFPEMLAALSNNAIDGGVTNEPTLSLVLQKGIAVRASPDAIYPGQQTAVVLYSEQFMRDRRALAEKFMIAYVRAIRDYNSALKGGKLAGPGAEDIIKVLTEYTPVKDASIYRQMSAFAVDPDGRLNLPALDNDLSFFRERGLISDAKLQAQSVVDNSFVEAAVAKLGPYKRPD